MRYQGNFFDLRGERYTVEIITNGTSGTTRNITLGVPPFITEMDRSEENIYKPCKYQSATVKLITSAETDYKFDIYSGNANGTKVRLYNSNNNLVWGGFATPVIYNNGFTEIHEELEISCIDGLSILQYYKYSTAKRAIKSLIEIVMSILVKCEVYTTLYVSANMYRDNTIPILNDIYISEQNFFDEKKDKETDDDVAWTLQEVLEEICRYLGYVCVGDGDKVYLLDYDAIKGNNNKYYQYSIGSTAYTVVNLAETKEISKADYMGAANTISLDNVYNKVSVKDSFYTFDSVIPDMYETSINITKSSDPDLQNSTNINNGIWGEVVSNANQGNQDGDTNTNMIALIDRVYDPQHDNYTDYNACFIKYYKNPNYTFYTYNGSSNNSLNYTDTKNYFGSCIMKADIVKLDKKPSFWTPIVLLIYLGALSLDKFLAMNEISNVSFSNYVMMLNPATNRHIPNSQITNYPFISSNETDNTAFFGGDNACLVITGKYIWHYFNEDPYPIPESEDIDISEGRYAMDEEDTYILAKLQWGNLYWNGTAWTTTNSTFQIRYMSEAASSSDRRADSTIFRGLDFVNTVTWRIGTNKKGYYIPIPQGKVLTGMPKITLYKPYDPLYYSTKTGDNMGEWYKHSVVFLQDFDIKAVIGDPSYSNLNESDTVYTNVIDNHHVQELDQIEFKICTNDNKNPNYSSVCWKDGSDYHFITNLTNSAMSLNKPAEELLINRLCNQYKTPHIRLSLQLDNTIKPYSILSTPWLSNKKFIVDSQSIDYYNNQSTITLVQK